MIAGITKSTAFSRKAPQSCCRYHGGSCWRLHGRVAAYSGHRWRGCMRHRLSQPHITSFASNTVSGMIYFQFILFASILDPGYLQQDVLSHRLNTDNAMTPSSLNKTSAN